jgi:hypothetical protein
MCDAGEFMQNNWEQDHDASQKDLTEPTVDPVQDVDPGFYADPTANFDPIVKDALRGAEDIGPLVDETLANLPAPEVPTAGPFTGLEGGVPGGSSTEAVVDFINGRGVDITDMVHQIESGQDLTPEQMAEGEHILKSGLNTDPLLVGDEIHNKAIDDLERYTYGNVQTDSNGVTWRYSPESDSWSRLEGGTYVPTEDIPPFQREHPSLSEFWGETADVDGKTIIP